MGKYNDTQPGTFCFPELESRVVLSPRDLGLIDLALQISSAGQGSQRKSKAELQQSIYAVFLEKLGNCSKFSWPFRYLQIDDASPGLFVQPPKVFAIHCVGQPLPELCKEQVPEGIALIAINPRDFLEQNCFVAQPVPLEHLKRV